MTQIQDPRYAGPHAQPFAQQQPYAQQPYGAYPPGGGFAPPPKRRRTGLVVGSVAGAVVVLGGLGVGAVYLFGSETLDTGQVEQQISALTQDSTGVAATDVDCPSDIEPQASGTFSCTAQLDGQETSFTVRQTDDEGNVEITSDDQYVVVADVEAYLHDEAVDQNDEGTELEVSCDTDQTVLVGAIGTPISCTVSDPSTGDYVDLAVTVDESGNISYEEA